MAFDSFMGSPTDSFDRSPDDGFITISTPTTPNPKMKNFGNTEMADFKKDESAMNLVNSPGTKSTFNLGSAPTPVVSKPKKAPKKGRLGDINWNSSDTLMVGGAFFIAGVMSSVLFNRYYK